MVILYSKIVGQPVAALQTQQRVGLITDLIFNDEFRIEGIKIFEYSFFPFFGKEKVFSAVDIVSWLKDGIIIGDADSVMQLSEFPRLERLIQFKLTGLRHKVRSNQGQLIGWTNDFLIDPLTQSITKIHITSLIRERIIPIKKVLSVEEGEIIIEDDGKSSKIKESIPEIAPANE